MDFECSRRVRVLGIGLVLLIAVLHAKTATVIGTITLQNNKPAVNVLVTIAGQKRFTDVGGRFRIDGIPFGLQKVTVSRGSTVLLERDVDVHNAMSVVNLQLP